MKRTLTEIFAEIGHFGHDIGCNDKGGVHSYLETYEKLFEPFRYGCVLMEIGLAHGGSLKLWNEYFEKSTIFGVDISIVFDINSIGLSKSSNEVFAYEWDATKQSFVDNLDKGGLLFDIIIDDASHQTQDQITTFNLLKHKMKNGGLYIIEDLLALDIERQKYLALHENVEIIDMRHTGRFDNALCVIKF